MAVHENKPSLGRCLNFYGLSFLGSRKRSVAPVEGQVDQCRCGNLLTVEGVLNKSLWHFYGPWDQRADKGSPLDPPRNGKVLGTESEWGKVFSSFLLTRNYQQRYLKKTSAQGLRYRDLGKKSPRVGMQICEEHNCPAGPESFTATPFRNCSALAVYQVWYGEGSLPL